MEVAFMGVLDHDFHLSFPLEYSRQKQAQLKEENFPIKYYLKIWLLFSGDELNSWIENVDNVKWP